MSKQTMRGSKVGSHPCPNCKKPHPLDKRQYGDGLCSPQCEAEYYAKDQKRVKIRPKSGGDWVVENFDENFLDFLKNSDPDCEYELKIQNYSKAELKGLPEFEGW